MATSHDHPEIIRLSMAQVAIDFPEALDVLNAYHLDFGCGGKQPFVEACQASGLDYAVVWKEVRAAASSKKSQTPHHDIWDTRRLIDYIEERHHTYVKKIVPEIQTLLEKVCNAHATEDPFLIEVKETFDRLSSELLAHIKDEEEVLFPAIRQQLEGSEGIYYLPFTTHTYDGPIGAIENEHESASRMLAQIRKITANYTSPRHASATFRVVYSLLKHFDADLMTHIHLEDNILFPRMKSVDKV